MNAIEYQLIINKYDDCSFSTMNPCLSELTQCKDLINVAMVWLEPSLFFATRLLLEFLKALLDDFGKNFANNQKQANPMVVLAFAVIPFFEDWDNDCLLPCYWDTLCLPNMCQQSM